MIPLEEGVINWMQIPADSILMHLECVCVFVCARYKSTSKHPIYRQELKKTIEVVFLGKRGPSAAAAVCLSHSPTRRVRKTRTGFHVQVTSIIHGIFKTSRPLQFVTVSEMSRSFYSCAFIQLPLSNPHASSSPVSYIATLSLKHLLCGKSGNDPLK